MYIWTKDCTDNTSLLDPGDCNDIIESAQLDNVEDNGSIYVNFENRFFIYVTE